MMHRTKVTACLTYFQKRKMSRKKCRKVANCGVWNMKTCSKEMSSRFLNMVDWNKNIFIIFFCNKFYVCGHQINCSLPGGFICFDKHSDTFNQLSVEFALKRVYIKLEHSVLKHDERNKFIEMKSFFIRNIKCEISRNKYFPLFALVCLNLKST